MRYGILIALCVMVGQPIVHAESTEAKQPADGGSRALRTFPVDKALPHLPSQMIENALEHSVPAVTKNPRSPNAHEQLQ